jgi:hypothetical protein
MNNLQTKTSMGPADQLPTPELRLAASRQRLMNYMVKGQDETLTPDHLQDESPHQASDSTQNSALQTLIRTAQVWWWHHPAKLALEIAQPALTQYAEKKPYQMLGLAAAAGAAAVLVRPWRLVSVTGLLLATVKSSGLANMALSLVSAQARPGLKKQKK